MSIKQPQMSELYIGLMSGTSIDGVDVALVDFKNNQCELLGAYLHPIPKNLRGKLVNIATPKIKGKLETSVNRIEQLAELDVVMGKLFGNAVNAALYSFDLSPENIVAIGSHGQTIRHRANYIPPYSLQIGDPNIIAEQTGIKTITDFRRMDIAAGGQGAPLAPAFHNAILRSQQDTRIILNLGGIANITLLAKDPEEPVLGFDTGPANALLDAWFSKHHPNSKDVFDRDSKFANQGMVRTELLNLMLSDGYFSLPTPKSTGKEYFHLDWLQSYLDKISTEFSAVDIQRTLLQLTTITITNAILKSCNKLCNDSSISVLCCGGGMHNKQLLSLLNEQLMQNNQRISVGQTNDVGVDGDYLEAMTFAWLAKQRVQMLPGNLPSVTGATRPKILGAEYLP